MWTSVGAANLNSNSGYSRELHLGLSLNGDFWGNIIFPMSSTGINLVNASPNAALNAFNLLQTETAINTLNFKYNGVTTPMLYYKNTDGTRNIFILQYLANTSVLTAFSDSQSFCPLFNVTQSQFVNCWDNAIAVGYGEIVSTSLRTNPAMWCFVFLLLVFFVWTNGAEKGGHLGAHLKDNSWTLHPWYSVLNYGTDEFTKTSRIALLTTTCACQEFFTSWSYYIWVNRSHNPHLYIWITPFAVWAISIPFTYWFASWLTVIYDCHEVYANKYKKNEDPKARELYTEQWELTKIKRYFSYYMKLMIINLFFFIASMCLCQHLELNDVGHWCGSLALTCFFDWAVADVICVFLHISLFRKRGYYLNYDLAVKMQSLEFE